MLYISNYSTGGSGGSGDVTGPGSSVDGNIALFNGTTGKIIKDSGIQVSSLQPKLSCVGKTSNYIAQPFELINCDISAGSFTITLPSAPADETVIYVKLNTVGLNNYLTIATSGTDKFNTATGNTEIYMYLFGEYAQMQYCAATGIWTTFISAGTFNFATNFPGIDATTPITEADVTIDTSTRVLTITPPLGYINIFVDGAGIITRFRKTGTINFPAFTDTSGTWYFYFDSTGTPITTQTAWNSSNFSTIATVWRLVWNNTLVGSAKLVASYVEYHLNTISAYDHIQYHINGAIHAGGLNVSSNTLPSGTPNADGRNAVIALSTGSVIDDNLPYTVTNSVAGTAWNQDMGDIVPATLNATNGGIFQIFTQDAGANISFLTGSRFPFSWNVSNLPEYITSTGTRTQVGGGNFFVYFVYATQNPRTGESIKIVSAPTDYGTLTNAQAITWATIQSTYPIFATDMEIRPLYRLIFLYNTGYNVGTKKSVLREITDIRKGAVTSTTVSGSLPASSVTFAPAGNIAATNIQTALEELDTEKQPAGSYATGTGTANGTNTGDQTSIVGITGTIAQFNTAVTDADLATLAGTETFNNKRVTLRRGNTTSSATPTINTDSYDIYSLTAQTVDITSFTTNLTGTPTHGQSLIIEITGTAARVITWGASFEASTVALPTTTVTTAMLTVGFKWNSTTSKWRCLAVV